MEGQNPGTVNNTTINFNGSYQFANQQDIDVSEDYGRTESWYC
nr:MAG TPA: hypothetical protein [Caudoviricetes sp.]